MNVHATSLSGFVTALALTLLHTLWQGAAAAGVLWAILKTIPATRARLRYAVACAALVATVTAGGITFTRCWRAASGPTARAWHSPPSISAEAQQTNSSAPASGQESGGAETLESSTSRQTVILPPEILPSRISSGREPSAETTSGRVLPGTQTKSPALPPEAGEALQAEDSSLPSFPQSSPSAAASQDSLFSPWMPWLAGLWAAGVILGILRLAAGWRVLRRWRRQARACQDAGWNAAFERLIKQLRISAPLRLLISAAAPVPMVIGWLRPVVVVPAELLTGLPAGQLEALLVHELAHIRRWDFGINLLQSAVDVLFFHHPGVRWISSRIRSEREHCCDDLAAGLCGGPLLYARALASLENLRPGEAPALCSAATGSPLVRRIRRLAAPSTPAAISPIWPVLAAAAAILLMFGGLPWLQAQEKPAASAAGIPAAPPSTPDPAAAAPAAAVPASSRKDREAQALEVVNSFLAAPTAAGKIGWLLPDEETRTAARTFYHRHPETAEAMKGTPFGPGMSGDDGEVFVAMEIPGLEGTYFFLVIPTAQGPRIDWLGSTCYLRQHFEDIRNDLPETPVRIRAVMRSGDYYNKAFADKSRYRCYELTHPGVDGKFFGYEPVADPAAPGSIPDGSTPGSLTELNLNPRAGIQIIEIKYPASPKDPGQVEIVRVLSPQHPSRPPVPRPLTSEPEFLPRKATSEFGQPGVDYSLHGLSDAWPANPRDFGAAAFDHISLTPGSAALSPASEVTLRMTDANKSTSPAFRILIGTPFPGGKVAWIRPGIKPQDGECRWPRKFMTGPVAVRIEADGLIPEMRTWNDPAKIPDEVVLTLQPDPGIKTKVLRPDGQPASGAAVALALYGQRAEISRGSLLHAGEPAPKTAYATMGRPRFLQADEAGDFLLPQEPDAQVLVVITHPSGVAEISHAAMAKNPEIRLRPWARIQGRVLNPDGAGGRKVIRFRARGNIRGTTDMVVQEDRMTVGADGAFVFENVLPGMVEMTRMIEDDPSSPQNVSQPESLTPFRAEPGENRVTIDGDRLTLEAAPGDTAPASPREAKASTIPPPDAELSLFQDAQPLRPAASDGKVFEDISLDYPDSLAAPKDYLPPPPALVIVTEAGTGKRIPNFRVMAGSVRIDDTISWQQPEEGTDGVLSLSPRLSEHGVLRVEAEGMMPQVLKWKTFAERPERFSLELKPDAGVKRQILLPDGSPAAGAAVAVVIGSQGVLLEDGEPRSSDQAASSPPPRKPAPVSRLFHADGSGEFILPAETDQTAPVIITHGTGILEIPYSKFLAQPKVTLQPWAEIEGQAVWGEIPGARVRITLKVERKPSVGDLTLTRQTITADADGKFTFRKVPPGTAMLYWEMTENSSKGFGVTAAPGSNTALIGGRGRTVTGTLTGHSSWEGCSLALEPLNAGAAPPDKQYPPDAWQTLSSTWKSFRKTPIGGAYFKANISIAADGQFEIRGVMPETYHLLLTGADGKTVTLPTPRSFSVAFEKPGEMPVSKDLGQIPVPPAREQP